MTLIGKDSKIEIVFGGDQDGTPTYGAYAVITGRAQSIEATDDLETYEVSGLGDTRKRFRGGQEESEVQISQFVQNGLAYVSDSTTSYTGNYVKVKITPKKTVSGTYQEFEGIVTQWKYKDEKGPQVEMITIKCDADKDTDDE